MRIRAIFRLFQEGARNLLLRWEFHQASTCAKRVLPLYRCFDHIFNHYDIQQIQDAKLLNKLKIIQL